VKPWEVSTVTLKFQLGDWNLYTVRLTLFVRSESPLQAVPSVCPEPPERGSTVSVRGYLIRSMPLATAQPVLSTCGEYLRYVPVQYRHCFIDLDTSFRQYEERFSPKTRSTLRRKIRRFAEHTGGTVAWKEYRRPEDLNEFFRHARNVSRLTYQERLLDVGLPDSQEFLCEADRLAREDRLRAFLLFDGERPVSYLYCPEKEDGILQYAYLGYDPEYQRWSVGTILQWFALEALFAERRFRLFDFTEGDSSHKLLFSSEHRLCANVYFLKRSVGNLTLIHVHNSINRLSRFLGDLLERYGLKSRIRKMLRRG